MDLLSRPTLFEHGWSSWHKLQSVLVMLKDFKTFQLAVAYYQACKQVKANRFLKDQLIRASSSIALNIAEGSGKPTTQDQKLFYAIALGSLRETQAILKLESIEDPALENLSDQESVKRFV